MSQPVLRCTEKQSEFALAVNHFEVSLTEDVSVTL